MKCNHRMRKTMLLGVLLFASAFGVMNSAFAAVTVVPLQMEQAKLLSAKIPQFDSGLDDKCLSQYNREYRENVLKDYQEFESMALATRAMPKVPEHMKSALTFHADYEVFRNDDRMISLVQKTYQYTGGAHGMSRQIGSTLSAVTGRRYALSDIFAEGADYASRLSEVVRTEGAARKLPLWGFKGVGTDQAFYLTDQGLVLFFLQYEIAPYSEGIVRFLIPYRELSDILRPEIDK